MIAADHIALRFLRLILSCCMLSLSLSFSGAVFSEKKWSFRLFGWCMLLHVILIPAGLFSDYSSLFLPVVSVFCIVVIYRFPCGMKGLKGFGQMLLGIGFCAASDIICGLILMLFFSQEQLESARNCLSPLAYLPNALTALLFALFVYLYSLLKHSTKKPESYAGFWRLIRSVGMGVSIFGIYFLTMRQFSSLPYLEWFDKALPFFVFLLLLLGFSASYAFQDIRYLRQSRLNDALLHQQEMQDALLRETRVFRHNIANLLYGFQGTLLSRDQKSIEEYYANLLSTCALINNENVVSLKRLPSLPLTALLLNKIQEAANENIPFYVFTDERLIYQALKDRDMCEIMGALLDNALEGARKSPAPLISVEFHNVGGDMEIVVRNTFDEAALEPNRSDVSFSTASSKAHHTGLGLQTVRRIVQSSDQALFNLFIQGRYVEASLLLGK